jgi:hypothetical protein
MTAEIVHALNQTAERAAVGAELARVAFRYAALELADEVFRTGRVPEPLVAAYAEARAKWTDEAARAFRAAQEASSAEAELANANPFVADEEAWTNERALQEAQTEKEAHA